MAKGREWGIQSVLVHWIVSMIDMAERMLVLMCFDTLETHVSEERAGWLFLAIVWAQG